MSGAAPDDSASSISAPVCVVRPPLLKAVGGLRLVMPAFPIRFCPGLLCSGPKTCVQVPVPGSCGCDLMWRRGLCRDDQVHEEWSSWIICVGPNSVTSILVGHRREGPQRGRGHVAMEAEAGGLRPQAQDARSSHELEEVEKSPPGATGGSVALRTLISERRPPGLGEALLSVFLSRGACRRWSWLPGH